MFFAYQKILESILAAIQENYLKTGKLLIILELNSYNANDKEGIFLILLLSA